jgi:hypothetical protein
VALDLFYLEAVGPKTITANMTNKNDKSGSDKHKLEQIVELLKFALALEDQEIIKSTVESIIDLLEDEINQ